MKITQPFVLSAMVIMLAFVLMARWMNADEALQRAEIASQDTVYIHTVEHDSIWVVSRAADTIKVTVHESGEVDEEFFVNMFCPKSRQTDNNFWLNTSYGYLACPPPKGHDDYPKTRDGKAGK